MAFADAPLWSSNTASGLFRLSRKHFRGILPYIFLAVVWIAWERWYLQSAEISWPWLVLGNAFAQSPRSIQWYEYTGTLGGSLWVWTVNISLFLLLKALSDGGWGRLGKKVRIASVAWLACITVLPFAASAHIYHHYDEKSEACVEVLIGQPNFDPYEKLTGLNRDQQDSVFLALIDRALEGKPDWQGLMLAPETFTRHFVLNDFEGNATWQRFRDLLQRYPQANILFGANAYRYSSGSAPSILARRFGDLWVENFNSALIVDATGRNGLYHKSKLVVGTELTPYPRIFVPVDDMLGGVMGRCQGQKDVSVLDFRNDSLSFPLGCAICYESVYGEYCAGYVRKGAKLMTVITNDAWWGNAPGFRQHFSYSRLRAIELRRDLVRCGNTGISAFIDQRGDVLSQAPWREETFLMGTANLNSEQTFFVRHGDIAGRICVFLSALLLLLLGVRLVTRKK